MKGALPDVTSGGRRVPAGHALLGVGVLLLLVTAGYLFIRMRRPEHVVETVTTGARAATAASAPTPVYFAPQLPARDAELEQAGDHIAEAEVYLKKRQGAAALAALTRARRAAARALESRQRAGTRRDALAAALHELDSVERTIERGAYEDARRQLIALDKSLDRPDF
ncbi:MAG: hypothetical protein QOH49_4 [Acidobacteriota bacterium]|jgi:hypothetical protein|nr:hypothetical protein [Acidobacteriota bacterium]